MASVEAARANKHIYVRAMIPEHLDEMAEIREEIQDVIRAVKA